MPEYTCHTDPPVLVFDSVFDDREDWAFAEQKFAELSEDYRTQSKTVTKLWDEENLVARRYVAGGQARINFFAGYIPKEYEERANLPAGPTLPSTLATRA